MGEDETSAYVKASEPAGRSTPAFNDAALARLHELSGGIPRRVQQLADLALLAGAGQNLGQIDVEVIDTVIGELGVVTQSGIKLANAWRKDPDRAGLGSSERTHLAKTPLTAAVC